MARELVDGGEHRRPVALVICTEDRRVIGAGGPLAGRCQQRRVAHGAAHDGQGGTLLACGGHVVVPIHGGPGQRHEDTSRRNLARVELHWSFHVGLFGGAVNQFATRDGGNISC